jgi:bifunctional non-homologous end joining protein LigD
VTPLDEYHRKRDPGATPEPMPPPEGGDDGRDGVCRFVVQEHHATRLHWDLRLERDGVLVSFAIPNALPEEPGVNRRAVHTEDHPIEYLDFHGEIPKGNYGAGSMTIWDRGTYERSSGRSARSRSRCTASTGARRALRASSRPGRTRRTG